LRTKKIYILGIESSCDETAASVTCNNKVLSNLICNQTIHKSYGGVVPELASREHQKNIIPVVNQALREAKISKEKISAIAYTMGPGLMGSLLVGTSFAKSFAYGLKIPAIEVNHMQAHILANFIADSEKKTPKFPFIGLTISGGHTQLVKVKSHFDMKVIGETIDDAIGEAFDKSGKVLGLEYPAGPEIDKLSKSGNPNAFSFAKPNVPDLNFSFSGLKTSILYFVKRKLEKNSNFVEENLFDLCASIQKTIIEILIDKLTKAVKLTKINRIVIGGGVSANSGIRNALKEFELMNDCEVYIPNLELTTDNAAMIAVVGYFKYLKKDFASYNSSASAKLKF